MRTCVRHWTQTAILAALGCLLSASAFAQTPADDGIRERLELERTRVLTEQHRWERFVDIQQGLARDPGRLARATEDAARELKGNGRALVVEGATGGLSSFLSLQSAYAGIAKDKKSAEQFKLAATLVSSVNTLAIKDLVQPTPDKWTPSAATMDELGKLNTVLKLIVLTQVKDENLRDRLDASLDLTKGTSGFLTAYLSGDQVNMQRLMPSVQGVLAGTLTMTKALAAEGPKNFKLQGVAASIAQEIPMFGPVAKMMATTALTDANISLAIANIGWGSYAMTNGFLLEDQAEEIRENQLQAAATMARILPKAKFAIERARESERRLSAEIDALGPTPPPQPPTVQPSARFIDDAPRFTLAPASLPATVRAIHETPSLNIKMTILEIDRRVGEQRNTTRQEEEDRRRREEEARRQQEAARGGAREEARRLAAEQRRWAEQADAENNDSNDSPSRSVSYGRSGSNVDMGHVRERIESVINSTLPGLSQ
jgi:hypothetical protein